MAVIGTFLRILIGSLNYYPEPTGIGKYSGEMGAWLAARGHDVHVIAGLPHYPQWRIDDAYRRRAYVDEEVLGVKVHRAPLLLRQGGSLSTADRVVLESSYNVASLAPWLRHGVFAKRFDVVIAVVPPVQTAVLPRLVALTRRTPLVVHVQDLQVDAAIQLGFFRSRPWLSRMLYGAEAALLRQASRVTTVSNKMSERIIQKGVDRDNVRLFLNWADVDHVRPLPRDTEYRAALGVSPSDVLVLYSGNMGTKQGLEVVVEAAAELANDTSIVFALVGDGAAKRGLMTMVRLRGLRNVRFESLVSWSDLPQLLAAGDIHLIPQKDAATDLLMPSKLGNILAAGRPLIATCRAGSALHSIVHESGAGIAVPPGSAAELAGAIRGMARDPNWRVELGLRGRAYAEAQLSKQLVLERFEQELDELGHANARTYE